MARNTSSVNSEPTQRRRKSFNLDPIDSNRNRSDQFSGYQDDLTPRSTTKQQLRKSSGLTSIKKEREGSDFEVNPTGELGNRRPSPNRIRRNDQRRSQTSGRRAATKLIKNAVDSKGNLAGLALKSLGDAELRKVFMEHFWILAIAVIGDLLDAIPFFIGFFINLICWILVKYLFDLKGVNFAGRVTKNSFGLMNVGAEVIVGAIAFWPGLTIGVIQTILSED
jgi:hypothetical protein